MSSKRTNFKKDEKDSHRRAMLNHARMVNRAHLMKAYACMDDCHRALKSAGYTIMVDQLTEYMDKLTADIDALEDRPIHFE